MEMMKSDEVLQKIDEEDGFRQHPTSEALGSPCGAGMAEKDTDDGVNTHTQTSVACLEGHNLLLVPLPCRIYH